MTLPSAEERHLILYQGWPASPKRRRMDLGPSTYKTIGAAWRAVAAGLERSEEYGHIELTVWYWDGGAIRRREVFAHPQETEFAVCSLSVYEREMDFHSETAKARAAHLFAHLLANRQPAGLMEPSP